MRAWATDRPGRTAARVAAVMLVAVLGGPVQQARSEDRLVVRFASGATAAERAQLREQADTDLVHGLPSLPGAQVVEADAGRARESLRALEASDDVVWAERDVRVRAAATPNDPRYPTQWWLPRIGAPAAWDTTTGSAAVTVAVVDTGVALDHPDLASRIWRNAGERGAGRETNGVDDDRNGLIDDWRGYDWVQRDNLPLDAEGHGTHVAATIGAAGGDGVGMTGVAQDVRLMPLRVLDERGVGWSSEIAQAIAYAGRAGAQVANLSLGGGFSHSIDDAIAGHPQMLVLAAAGNDGADSDTATNAYPCALPHANVVCVTATDSEDRVPAWANTGRTSVDVAAPGAAIAAAQPAVVTPFGDDFEAARPANWERAIGLARTTRQARSGSWSYGATIPRGTSTGAGAGAGSRPFWVDSNVRCWIEGQVWYDAAKATNWITLDIQGLPDFDLRIPGGPDAPRTGAFIREDLPPMGGEYRLDIDFFAWDEPNAVSGAFDDVAIRCMDPARAPGASYASLSGTSMATAVASGAAALVLGRRPGASVASVRAALLDTVDPLASLAGRTVTGGRLNVGRAVSRALIDPATQPAPETYTGTLPVATAGRPGSVDPAFAAPVGFSFTQPNGAPTSSAVSELVTLGDGSIIAAGAYKQAAWVARVTPSGARDPSFGTSGVTVTRLDRPPNDVWVGVYDVALAPDGRILVAGAVTTGATTEMVVLRYRANGTLDPTFDGDGVRWLDFTGNDQAPAGIAVDPQGRAIVAFWAESGRLGLTRLTAVGGIDASFASGGVYLTPNIGNDDFTSRSFAPGDVARLPDGRIVVVGASWEREIASFAARFTPNGDLDTTFGTGGYSWVWSGALATKVDVDPLGRLLLGGRGMDEPPISWRPNNPENRAFAGRLHADGRPDQSFGIHGVRYLQLTRRVEAETGGLVSLPDGGALVLVETGPDRALARLFADGRLDTGFGTDGFARGRCAITAVAAGAQGEVAVGGELSDGAGACVDRLLGGRLAGSPDPGPGDPGPDPDEPEPDDPGPPDPEPEPEPKPDPDPDVPDPQRGPGDAGDSIQGPGAAPPPPAALPGDTGAAASGVKDRTAQPSLRLTRRGRRLEVRATCPPGPACRWRITVRSPRQAGRTRKLIARRTVRVRPGRTLRLTVVMPKAVVRGVEVELRLATTGRRLDRAVVGARR